jgi:hypothetical protein
MMHGVKCIMNMIGTIMHVVAQMAVYPCLSSGAMDRTHGKKTNEKSAASDG